MISFKLAGKKLAAQLTTHYGNGGTICDKADFAANPLCSVYWLHGIADFETFMRPQGDNSMNDPSVATNLQLDAVPNPLRIDDTGTIRIGSSRVTLDLVVEQYESGQTPDEMVRAYDTLDLADVHAAIAYFLRHRNEVLAYIRKRTAAAESLRATAEASRPSITRDELTSRRQR